MFKKLYEKFSNDIGIDLGTANTLVYVKGHGIVINEPSIVAINQKTGVIVAIGEEAKKMWGKTPTHIKIVRPLVGGVVSDFEVTEEMLSYFLKKAEKISPKFFRPRVLLGVPSGITNIETRAVYDAAINAGAREVHLVEEAMAGAIGVRLPVLDATATCVVDIGGGTTDIALISLGGMVRSMHLKVAGDTFNQNIIDYIRDQFKLFIGDQTAEEVKIAIGAALDGTHREYEVRGRDAGAGLPRGIVVTDGETDFVAQNEDFKALAHKILDIAWADGEAAAREQAPALISDVVLKIGENIQIASIEEITGSTIGVYTHHTGKNAAVVVLEGGNAEVAKNIAMHTAAMKPVYLSSDQVDEAAKAQALDIIQKEVGESDKPEEIKQKMFEGKMATFFKEQTLLDQAFFKAPEQTIAQYAAANGAKVLSYKIFTI